MSTREPPHDAPIEDLSIRARRLGLSAADHQQFARVLASNPTLRTAHQLGCDFDSIAGVRTGDEALIARTVDAVLARRTAPRRRARAWSWGFGLAAALVASVAGAWRLHAGRAWLLALSAKSEVGIRSPEGPPPPALPATIERGPAPSPVSAPAGATNEVEPHATRAARPELARPPVASPPASGTSPEVSAADLFRRANAARRASDLAGARSLYTELEAKYPSSDEARLARVSLGKLLLSTGRAVEAEHQFSQYLAQGSSELTEEALVGRAESLGQLGRAADERQDWRRLVRDFPSSVYTERAKRRLEELDSRLP